MTLTEARERAAEGVRKRLGVKRMRKLEAAVRRGAKLLDREKPGWAKSVKLTTLRMADGFVCVLGQAYAADSVARGHVGGWTTGRMELDIYGDPEAVAAHGFCTEYADPAPAYEYLDQLWADAIRARRAKKK